ncbi:small ribosomal subunit protein bS6m-like [Ylistrum balloti]|uniref:small ribosomal subunit protein bS6m-like n=1 Tax=Ylistrum balloti TaxID=509963 RepID=UPI002905EC17|nr:small ribosomal subunit protein bS6m-like [Ylistrum balloti]
MPRYELALILKNLPKEGLANALKRSCQVVWEQEGVVRKIENLGTKSLPYKMKAHGSGNTTGSYFVMNFDASTDGKEEIQKKLHRDAEIIRPTIFNVTEDEERPCIRGLECQFDEDISLVGERLSWRTKALKKANLYKDLKRKQKN